MLEEILEYQRSLIKANEILEKFNYADALAIIAMLLEENCKRNGEDMIECVENLLKVAKQVREECGVY